MTQETPNKATPAQREHKVLLQVLAGVDADDKAVMEHVEAYALEKDDYYELIKSPLFVRNLAQGDIFHLHNDDSGRVDVIQRSGKLCIRVYRKENIAELELRLTPEVEKLDGSLDIQADRALVYSLHVNNGFGAIETLFDGIMSEFTDSVWYYGNIYDPADGITPLNWWDEFLNQT